MTDSAPHNLSCDTRSTISQELEDRIMAALPKPLADWLRYDATTDICPRTVFQEWRAGTPVDRLLAALRGITRKETRLIYGARHPQASLI